MVALGCSWNMRSALGQLEDAQRKLAWPSAELSAKLELELNFDFFSEV